MTQALQNTVEDRRQPGTVLIDNDPLIRLTWEAAAYTKQVKLKTFPSVQAFLAVIQEFPKDTIIYIDSDLGDGVLGEKEAEKLFQLGFTSITLETAFPEKKWEAIREANIIQEIIGKEPPWK